MSQNDIQSKFKEIIAKLPEDKKKELYDKLRNMSSEERNRTIIQLVEKNEQLNKKEEDKPQSTKKETAPQKVQTKKEEPKKQVKRKPKKRLNKKGVKFLISTFVIIVVLTALIIFIVKNNSKIMELITPTTTTTETSDSEATTAAPTATPSPTPSPSPTPTPIPLADDAPDLSGLTVVIDPGHQEKTSERQETFSTSSKNTKPGATSGSTGVVTGIHEYEFTLLESLKIKEYLEACGANVILTRSENDIDLTNQERAQIATASNCDVFIRIHADGANDSAASGIRIFVAEGSNKAKETIEKADILGELLSEAEGIEYLGAIKTNVYTGLNYANKIPAMQVSLGYLTNSDDEDKLVSEEVQYNIAVKFAEFLTEYKK